MERPTVGEPPIQPWDAPAPLRRRRHVDAAVRLCERITKTNNTKAAKLFNTPPTIAREQLRNCSCAASIGFKEIRIAMKRRSDAESAGPVRFSEKPEPDPQRMSELIGLSCGRKNARVQSRITPSLFFEASSRPSKRFLTKHLVPVV